MRLLSVAGLSALTAILMAGSFYAGRKSKPGIFEAYVNYRKTVLEHQAIHSRHGGILIIGDSLTERSGLTELCGRPVFNAGVSTATLHDLAPLAEKLNKVLEPEEVWLAIGTNDAWRGTNPDEWADEYADVLGKLGPNVKLVKIPPASAKIDPAAIDRLNTKMNSLGAFAVEVPAFPTYDGIHPTESGSAIWRSALANAC